MLLFTPLLMDQKDPYLDQIPGPYKNAFWKEKRYTALT